MTIYSKMFTLFIKIKWKYNFQFLSLGLAVCYQYCHRDATLVSFEEYWWRIRLAWYSPLAKTIKAPFWITDVSSDIENMPHVYPFTDSLCFYCMHF